MAGMDVLEIGPGEIRHLPNWHTYGSDNVPRKFVLADVKQEMLDESSVILDQAGIPHEAKIVSREEDKLPFGDNSFDRVISFYALEHIHPLAPYLDELHRILKPGGLLIGSIPAEGGLAWGLGRFLTSRRWLKANTTIDPDKIICWEHPNFATDILHTLQDKFEGTRHLLWPFPFLPMVDCNLVVKFTCSKAP